MELSRAQLLMLSTVMFVASLLGVLAATGMQGSGSDWRISHYDTGYDECNVLEVKVHGGIVSSGSAVAGYAGLAGETADTATLSESAYVIAVDVVPVLRDARSDPSIKALILDVDSYGGSSAAGHEIADAVRRFGKPSVAVIHEAGVSSGYLVAAAADTVFAAEESSVGSIGVTSSFVTYATKNARDGVTFEELASGPFKDTFSQEKPLTAAERALIMRDIRASHDHFVSLVALFRTMPTSTVAALADGSTLRGGAARDAGLIDRVGFYDDATAYLEDLLGEPIVVCQSY